MRTHFSRRRRCIVLGAAIWLGVVSCGGSDSGTEPAPVRVAAVEVTGNGTVVAAGQTLQLTAVAKVPDNAIIAAVPITWSSSSVSVASVSTTGLVRGLSAGSATITASAGGKAATWDISVRDTTSLPRTLSGRMERVDVSLTGDYAVTGDLVLRADRCGYGPITEVPTPPPPPAPRRNGSARVARAGGLPVLVHRSARILK